MAERVCTECGDAIPSDLSGGLCGRCRIKKLDYDDFELHRYTREELASVPLTDHLVLIVEVGLLYTGTSLLLCLLGGLFGAAVLDDFGSCVGLLAGAACGLGLSRKAWQLPPCDKYEMLMARRWAVFVLAAGIFGLIGGLAGLIIPAAAGWRLPGEHVLARVLPGVIGVAILGPTFGMAGACLAVYIADKGNKSSYLANFHDWRKRQSERSSTPTQ